MVEGGGLLNRCTGKTVPEVQILSSPPLKVFSGDILNSSFRAHRLHFGEIEGNVAGIQMAYLP